jgi:multicomponent K+:H+ antiporter subunit E
VLALVLPPLLGRLVPDARVRRPGLALRLLATLLWDIVVANLQVARRILGPEAAIRPRFVWVPLDIASDHGIVTLAAMITMTPGTLSAEVSADRRALLVHALDCDDASALVAEIKRRYERPLMEILP